MSLVPENLINISKNLSVACQYGDKNLEMVMNLVEHGAIVNMVHDRFAYYPTPLPIYSQKEPIRIIRLGMYEKRKSSQVLSMETKVRELSNRARFIVEVISGKLDLRKMVDDAETAGFLVNSNFDKQDDTYDYLTHMPMHSMNKARVSKLKQEKEDLYRRLEELHSTSVITIWMRELDVFVQEYIKYRENRKKQGLTVSVKPTIKKPVRHKA